MSEALDYRLWNADRSVGECLIEDKETEVMAEVNSKYRAQSRSVGLKAQIDKVEGLAHHWRNPNLISWMLTRKIW